MEYIPITLLILSGVWVIFNIFWLLILFVKKFTKKKLVYNRVTMIKDTIKINIIYICLFFVLGFLLL